MPSWMCSYQGPRSCQRETNSAIRPGRLVRSIYRCLSVRHIVPNTFAILKSGRDLWNRSPMKLTPIREGFFTRRGSSSLSSWNVTANGSALS